LRLPGQDPAGDRFRLREQHRGNRPAQRQEPRPGGAERRGGQRGQPPAARPRPAAPARPDRSGRRSSGSPSGSKPATGNFSTFNNLLGGVFMALMDPYGRCACRCWPTWRCGSSASCSRPGPRSSC
jgi:hypothetical protein